MKLALHPNRAFTLVEVSVASAVAAIILVSIVIGGVSLQKTFTGSDDGLKGTADQSRVLDYLTRDLRQALTVSVGNSGQTLTLTLTDYIDPATKAPRMPSVKPGIAKYGLPKGVVDYGTVPITVSYFPAAAPASAGSPYVFQANGPFMVRQEGATQMVIARDSTSLRVNFTDQVSSILASVSFAPRFNFRNDAADRNGTILYATATLRNTRR